MMQMIKNMTMQMLIMTQLNLGLYQHVSIGAIFRKAWMLRMKNITKSG